jgi:electron transfer flavoprotein alpha subunit
MNIKNVLIYAEVSGGVLQPGYLELLSKAKDVLAGADAPVFSAAYAGPADETLLEEVASSGFDKVYAMESELLAVYHPEYHAKALEEIIYAANPDLVLIAATSAGEELAPSLGIRLQTGVAAHCVDILRLEDGKLAQMVPAFGGKVIGEIFTENTRPAILSVKQGLFTQAAWEDRNPPVETLSADLLSMVQTRIRVEGVEAKQATRLPLDKAEIIVCAGSGAGGEAGFKKATVIASRLSGAVGYTRPVVDAGWAEDEENMIGTSGKSARPKVYLGFGVSGATHHVCGMKDSGVIISVNTDARADVFQVSDFTVVADSEEILDALMKKLNL